MYMEQRVTLARSLLYGTLRECTWSYVCMDQPPPPLQDQFRPLGRVLKLGSVVRRFLMSEEPLYG